MKLIGYLLSNKKGGIMESIFSKIFVTKAEYSIFRTMHSSEQLRWLFDTFDATSLQIKGLDLSSFFAEVRDNLDQYAATPVSNQEATINDLPTSMDNTEFVDVMIDDENIMIESNSLRAVRHVVYKFAESGYILRRDLATEKMFRKDKTTKYIRVFRIINYANSMCLN
jgi:hypothetical protein